MSILDGQIGAGFIAGASMSTQADVQEEDSKAAQRAIKAAMEFLETLIEIGDLGEPTNRGKNLARQANRGRWADHGKRAMEIGRYRGQTMRGSGLKIMDNAERRLGDAAMRAEMRNNTEKARRRQDRARRRANLRRPSLGRIARGLIFRR